MNANLTVAGTHPAGEAANGHFGGRGAWPVDTPGGRFYAEWEEEVPVTREGQLVFFFQFLEAGARWERFMGGCPLSYTGNRGSGARNVMGTVMLSVLCGHWRYAHINAVRGDRVNPALLGMDGTVSEDAVRAAMKRIGEERGLAWLGGHLRDCIEPVLGLPWILDIDTTVKPLYGHQQGAEIGYNPHKPGRPSHAYHSYFMAGLRLCLGVDVMPGKRHAGAWGTPGLWRMLDGLPREKWPCFGRGDCGYGNERTMLEFEVRGLPYLFKLRHSPKVKGLVKRLMASGARWQDAGDGWEAIEARLRLGAWSRERRVVLVREKPAVAPAGDNARRRRDHQQALPGASGEGWEGQAAPWCGRIAVLVTSLDGEAFPTPCMPRLYRERGDAENIYDELKNQWGWNGYTTRKLAPCRLMANLIALFHNWWSLYARLFDEGHHREAITSRPALMQGVARETRSGGRRTIKVGLLHEKGDVIMRAVTLISGQLHAMASITERWTPREKWTLLLTRILRRWLGGKWLPGLPEEAALALSG
jgi:hypothetical protein